MKVSALAAVSNTKKTAARGGRFFSLRVCCVSRLAYLCSASYSEMHLETSSSTPGKVLTLRPWVRHGM